MKKVLCFLSMVLMSGYGWAVESDAHPVKHKRPLSIGVNYLYNTMRWQKDYGANLFPKHTHGLGVNAEYMFNKNFGIEVGYEKYRDKKRENVYLGPGERIAGYTAIDAGDFEVLNTELRQYRLPVHLVGKIYDDYNNYGMGALVIGVSKIKAFLNVINSSTGATGNKYYFNNNEIIPGIKIAIGHVFDNHFNIQVGMVWHNMNILHIKECISNDFSIKPKNSMVYQLGLSYNILKLGS